MTRNDVDLHSLPVRFSLPDGWRDPHPQWISLYQGFEPPSNWKPYEDAPVAPPSWPWWEENGTAWYTFFRSLAPLPARALGNWFSLAALGLFTVVVSPFALQGWFIGIGGLIGVGFVVFGIRGVVRTHQRQSSLPQDPMEAIRDWALHRRETYFDQAYRDYVSRHGQTLTIEEFREREVSRWWSETSEGATNS